MYGSVATGAGTVGASLAVTGTNIGSLVLAGIGFLFVGSALVLLARRPGKVRP